MNSVDFIGKNVENYVESVNTRSICTDFSTKMKICKRKTAEIPQIRGWFSTIISTGVENRRNRTYSLRNRNPNFSILLILAKSAFAYEILNRFDETHKCVERL